MVLNGYIVKTVVKKSTVDALSHLEKKIEMNSRVWLWHVEREIHFVASEMPVQQAGAAIVNCKIIFKITRKILRVIGTFFFLISLSLGETLLLEPFDGKVYDLLPVFLPELLSCPSNHLCLAPIF